MICSGPSMYPTIQDGDLVLAERFSEYFCCIVEKKHEFAGVANKNVRVGDIVGCLNPQKPQELLCKRIAAKVSNLYLSFERNSFFFRKQCQSTVPFFLPVVFQLAMCSCSATIRPLPQIPDTSDPFPKVSFRSVSPFEYGLQIGPDGSQIDGSGIRVVIVIVIIIRFSCSSSQLTPGYKLSFSASHLSQNLIKM